MFENPVANANPFEGFSQGLDITAKKQAIGLAQTQMQLQKQKLLQEQAVLALGQQAAQTGDPKALAMYSAVNPEGGKGLRENMQYFTSDLTKRLQAIKDAKITDRPAVYEVNLPYIRNTPYFDASQYVDKYSPDLDKFIDADINHGTNLNKEYSLIETGNGFVKFNKDTGEFEKTGLAGKPNSEMSGGATGAVVRQIMRDNPGMNFTQALQMYQTGFRQGTRINNKGEIETIPGYAEAKTETKAAESQGTAFGKETGEKKALLRSMNAKMPELNQTVNKLYQLSDTATYTKLGNTANKVRKELGLQPGQGAIDQAQYIAIVHNQILPLLRDTFGPQFTQKEGEKLESTLGDPNLSPPEKKAVLDAFINQKRMAIQSLQREVENQKSQQSTNYSEEDINHTAQKYGITPEEVRRRLKEK